MKSVLAFIIFSISFVFSAHAKEGFVEVFGTVGKPQMRYSTASEPVRLFWSSGLAGGFKTKFIRIGVGVEYNVSKYKTTELMTDYLGNLIGEEDFIIKNHFVMPSVSISSQFGLEKFYPLVGLQYGLSFFTKRISQSPSFGTEVFNRSDIVDFDSTSNVKVGQVLSLKAGAGYAFMDNKFAIEASFRYQVAIKDGFYEKIFLDNKQPYQLGAQISLLYNFGRKSEED